MPASSEPSYTANRRTTVFISYSRKDAVFADDLERALRARGFDPLLDRAEIVAFEDWWKRIQGLISKADTIIFVLSPDAVASEICSKEVAYAASLTKRFAPIVCRRVDDGSVPAALRRLNFIFFDEQEQFESRADQLAQALETDIDWIRQHTDYGESARRWETAGRPGGLLLHSPVLEVAEHWIKVCPRGAPEPTPEIHSLITESRRGAQSAHRVRRLAQSLIMTLLLGIIFGLLGWINQDYLKERWTWYTAVRPFLARSVWPYTLTTAAEQALKPDSSRSFRECAPKRQHEDLCPDMIVVPAGAFLMGSPPTAEQPQIDLDPTTDAPEAPQHEVRIERPFAVSKFPITYWQWLVCKTVGDCPKDQGTLEFDGDGLPVLSVDWNAAQTYAAWLSRITGKTYRLLSEAEYEYATRGGMQTTYPWGNEVILNSAPMANCVGCSSTPALAHPVAVGSYPPNRFGLHDMVGNASSWTRDCFHENYVLAPNDGSAWDDGVEGGPCQGRVIRGGSYDAKPENIRSAYRSAQPTGLRTSSTGFRVARTISDSADTPPKKNSTRSDPSAR